MKYNPDDAVSLIPDGTYEASIKAVSDTTRDGDQIADKSGNLGEAITFEVYVGAQVRNITETFYAGPKSLWRYAMLASALGEKDAFKAGQFQASKFVGVTLSLELGKREYEGRDYQQIKTIKSSQVAAAATGGKVGTAATITAEDIPF